MHFIKHIDEWVILACLLFTATAALVAVEDQILTLTLTGHFENIPASQTPSQTLGGYVWTSSPVLPQVFFFLSVHFVGLGGG
jgi:hypothetical protein